MPEQDGRFDRKHRLKRPEEFRQVFRSSCRSADGYLLVIARQNGLQYARLGLAISRKKIRLAVDRNSLKRQLRESFRQHKQLLSGLDVVVVSLNPPPCNKNRVLTRNLTGHWQKISKCRNS
ncbi:MAG TPA: ribonuclease P protein component [Gammaproteobacteria bacterium]|nr:ribonuclease P protein component [Gammaproteobacteria bacterium]